MNKLQVEDHPCTQTPQQKRTNEERLHDVMLFPFWCALGFVEGQARVKISISTRSDMVHAGVPRLQNLRVRQKRCNPRLPQMFISDRPRGNLEAFLGTYRLYYKLLLGSGAILWLSFGSLVALGLLAQR